MSSTCLDGVIRLSPGFKTAVHVRTSLDDDRKVAAYIPTEAASEVLLDLAENLHPLASRRSRILTGTYGTGKSHLALVLARVYRDGVTAAPLVPVMEKLGKWPGKLERLRRERSEHAGRFLLVLLDGDEGEFDDALLRRLDDALNAEGLQDVFPETAFSAALTRVDEIRQKDRTAFANLAAVAKDFGFPSVEALEGQLKNRQRSAYDRFCEIHKALFVGAPFYSHHGMTPGQVYPDVARRLVKEKGYAGIVVIWDEFGRYVERVMNDPRGTEGQHVQAFAEGCCNSSGAYQVHMYLVSHRSLREYAAVSALARASGTSKRDQEEWTKISGRFREFNMTSRDREVFDLMDQVVLQQESDPAWIELVRSGADHFDELTDQCLRLGLIPDLTRQDLHRTVTVGAYPLHPMTAFCLPRISERVAQNERTLFTFLSDSGEDTLGAFIRRTALPSAGERPPFLSADRLWDFFAQDVRRHPVHRRVASKFDHADAMIDPDDHLAKRIIKAVAVLSVVDSDRAPCTEAMIGFCLGLRGSEQPVLREKLKALCSRVNGRDRVLVQSVANGAYRFTGASSDGLDSQIDRTVDERLQSVSPSEHLRCIASELGIPIEIPATAYSDDYHLPRALEIELVTCPEIERPERWIRNLGADDFVDGYALIVLCESGDEIRRARELAATILKHDQILFGIPMQPLQISALLRRHEAVRYLEKTQAGLFGKAGELREEWEQQDRDLMDAIKMNITPLLDPEKRLLSWILDGREVSNVGTASKLRTTASEMMRKVFPLTPVIVHDRLTSQDGKDSFVSARRAIITKLLARDGPTLLARETNSRDKTVIDFVYRRNGILQSVGSTYVIAEPDNALYPAMNALWHEVEKAVDAAKAAPLPMSVLVSTLRKPPYGMRLRSIPLIVSAVLRRYVLRGNISFESARGQALSSRITRIDGTVLDDAVMSADQYRLVYTEIGQKQEAILFGVADAFNVSRSAEVEKGDLLERIRQSVGSWWRGLPAYGQRTLALDEKTTALRDRILKPLAQEDADAQAILLRVFADSIHPSDQKDSISAEAVADLVGTARRRVERAVEDVLIPRIHAVVCEVFCAGESVEGAGSPLSAWYASLPPERRDIRLPGDATILARIARSVASQEKSSTGAALQLASEITGTEIDRWGDDMLERFRGRLEGAKRAAEEAEVARVPHSRDGDGVIVPEPRNGQVHLVVSMQDEVLRRTFVLVTQISPMGHNLHAILRESIKGIGRALPAGECETIIINVIKEFLA